MYNRLGCAARAVGTRPHQPLVIWHKLLSSCRTVMTHPTDKNDRQKNREHNGPNASRLMLLNDNKWWSKCEYDYKHK